MLRIGNISEVSQTRTLRVNYGNTQAYPFATNIDPTVYNISGASAGVFSGGNGRTLPRYLPIKSILMNFFRKSRDFYRMLNYVLTICQKLP